MRKLSVFNNVTIDGHFVDPNGDMSWAYADSQDEEWNVFVSGNASAGGPLLFGRITYEMMASYWPTPMALENDPVVAKHMNELPKIVFSRTMDEASWANTRLVKNDMIGEVRRMKQEPGDDLTILGSGSVVAQLAQAGLIDEYQIVVNPIALGKGRSMFDGISKNLPLKLVNSRAFGNGKVVLTYVPTAS